MSKSRDSKANRSEQLAELTEAEWEIIKVVWQNQPCTAGTVQEILSQNRNRAYSTVKTLMDRMVDKGFLQIEKIRNLQLFKSCISEVDAKRGEFRKMLKRAFDGAMTPMMQFLVEHEDLSKDDISQFRKLINKVEKKSVK